MLLRAPSARILPLIVVLDDAALAKKLAMEEVTSRSAEEEENERYALSALSPPHALAVSFRSFYAKSVLIRRRRRVRGSVRASRRRRTRALCASGPFPLGTRTPTSSTRGLPHLLPHPRAHLASHVGIMRACRVSGSGCEGALRPTRRHPCRARIAAATSLPRTTAQCSLRHAFTSVTWTAPH